MMKNIGRRGISITNSSSTRRYISTQAIVYDRLGSPDTVLGSKKVEVGSKLGQQDVLVKMVMANVNKTDLNSVAGLVPGVKSNGVCGNEGLGIVEEVGSGVKGLKKGDHVVPTKNGMGTWATYAVQSADGLANVPSDLTPEQASLLGSDQASAAGVLEGSKKGDGVIVNGADSALGFAVVQIAKSKGMNVVCVVSESCIDYKGTSSKLKKAGADIVIDAAGASSSTFKKTCADLNLVKGIHACSSSTAAADVARVLEPCSTLYSVVGAGPVTVPSSLLIDRGILVTGYNLEANLKASGSSTIDGLVKLIKDGKLTPFVASTESLSNFQKAMHSVSTSTGSVILKM